MNKSPLASRLSSDEHVIWQGRPLKKAFWLKTVFNIFLPIVILWLSFDLTFILGIFGEDFGAEEFFVIPFFLLHMLPVWIYLGNIIFAFRRYQNTEYILTDKNLYLANGVFSKEVHIKPLSHLSDLQTRVGLVEKFCHVGSIIVGNEDSQVEKGGMFKTVSIECISDFEDVLKRIQELQYTIASDFSYPNKLR